MELSNRNVFVLQACWKHAVGAMAPSMPELVLALWATTNGWPPLLNAARGYPSPASTSKRTMYNLSTLQPLRTRSDNVDAFYIHEDLTATGAMQPD